jgi:hypothetical protein
LIGPTAAREALNSARLTEADFGAAEAEWFAAVERLEIDVEEALGVNPRELAALLS